MSTPDPIAVEMVRAEPPCPNCGTGLRGPFCHECGQPRQGMIRHLPGLIADFFDSVFNLDTRTIRTIKPLLLKPGFLSIEYFAGRRTRYVTPLRLYLFLSVIAFLAVSMVSHPRSEGGNVNLRVGQTVEERIRDIDADEREALAQWAQRRDVMPEPAIAAQQARIRAEAEAEREAVRENDQHPLDVTAENPNPFGVSLFGRKPWHPVTNPLAFRFLPDAANRWLNGQVGRLLVNAAETRKHPDKFVSALFSVAPQALLMILPVFALLLKVFYLFKRRLYMEHLIVALHSHSFLCLAILLLVALTQLESSLPAWPLLPTVMTVLIGALVCWIPLYLLMAQKRVYGQGWPMTLLKYLLIGTAYLVLLSFGIVVNLIWALATL